MNRFKNQHEWVLFQIKKNSDCDPYIICENCVNWLSNLKRKFSEMTTEELENAEII